MARALLEGALRDVAVVTFAIDPRRVLPLVPIGTELDTFHGRALVSVVGFQLGGSRLFGIPLPFARSYDQILLTLPVRREVRGGWRRGIVLVREYVPVPPIVAGAGLLEREGYERHPVSGTVRRPTDGDGRPGRAVYRWLKDDRVHRMAVDFGGPLARPAPGTIEEFVADRPWRYLAQPGRATLEYAIDHPPWRVWRARAAPLTPEAAASFGDRYEEPLSAEPAGAYVAEGSRIRVHRPAPLPLPHPSELTL